ncbi:MAG: hypothetical protein ACHQAX_04940 [Gammaproteobacteria bacterium]
MAFRTYAWFYGSDYQLINIHDARQKDHPYYGDEQLYGATDVHSFSTYNFIREVTQRVVVNDKDHDGRRRVYEKGTPEWDEKFKTPIRAGHSNELIYEEFIERPDGWFEFEIPLGFTSVDLFESVTTAKRLTEILMVMYRRDDSGALIPAYQHVFQDCQLQGLKFNVSLDDTFSHRLQCKVHYAKYEYQYYTDAKSNPMTHAFMRQSMSIKDSALADGKARVQVASEYVKKMLATPETMFKNYFMPVQAPKTKKYKITLHKITPENVLGFNDVIVHKSDLEDFYFCIAPREYSHTEFVNSLYETPSESKRNNLLRVNPHIGKVIQAGQIVYVVNPEDSIYKKMKPYLDSMAQKIEEIRQEYAVSNATFFSDYFALMGSFAESVGINPGEYYSLEEKELDEKLARIESLDDINSAAGITTSSAGYFFTFVKDKIELIDKTHYKTPYRIDARETQIIGFKQIRERAHKMFDELKNGTPMLAEEASRSGLVKESPVQRWVAKGDKLVSLDKLYKSVFNAYTGMKLLGYAGIGFDAVHTTDRIVESCAVYREDACRKLKFEEWGGFAGRVGSGMLLAAGLGLVPLTGGWSLVLVISANVLLADPLSNVGEFAGEKVAVIIEEMIYEE